MYCSASSCVWKLLCFELRKPCTCGWHSAQVVYMPGIRPTATAYTFPLLLGLLFCGFGLFVSGVGLALLTDLPFPTQRCGRGFIPVRGCVCVLNRGGDLCFCGLFRPVLCR